MRKWTRGGNDLCLVAILSASILMLWCTAAGATTVAAQTGWNSAQNIALNGAYAVENPHTSFNPSTGQCVTQSTLIYNSSVDRQVELGLLRCTNAQVDNDPNSCHGGYSFIETDVTGDFQCYQKGAFSTTDQVEMQVSRSSSSSTTFYGYINDTSVGGLGGFSVNTANKAYAWGENTAATPGVCNWGPFDMKFAYFEKEINSTWVYVNDRTINNTSCQNVSTIDSHGDFDVTS